MSILLVIVLLLFFPMGGTQEMDADNYCGPKAVDHIVEQVNGSDFDGTVKPVETNLGPWEHLPEEMPYVGGAIFPWGICHAMKKEGIKGKVSLGPCELGPAQEPFIALIRKGQDWHYVAVFEVQGEGLVMGDGHQAIAEFLSRWR